MTTETITLAMRQQDPPPRDRYRPNAKNIALINIRRQQLHDNAGVWFVWQDDARNRSYERKVAWQLLGLRQGSKFYKSEIPYELRSVRNNNNDLFTLYVRYTGNPEGGK